MLKLWFKITGQHESILLSTDPEKYYLQKMIIEDINFKTEEINFVKNGTTPLTNASIDGSEEYVSLLLKHGANVNPPSHLHPLAIAIIKKRVNIARLLIKNGANVNAENMLSLSTACSTSMTRLLLQHNASPFLYWSKCWITMITCKETYDLLVFYSRKIISKNIDLPPELIEIILTFIVIKKSFINKEREYPTAGL